MVLASFNAVQVCCTLKYVDRENRSFCQYSLRQYYPILFLQSHERLFLSFIEIVTHCALMFVQCCLSHRSSVLLVCTSIALKAVRSLSVNGRSGVCALQPAEVECRQEQEASSSSQTSSLLTVHCQRLVVVMKTSAVSLSSKYWILCPVL